MINWSTSRINFGGSKPWDEPHLLWNPWTPRPMLCRLAASLASFGEQGEDLLPPMFFICWSSWVSHVFPPYPCHSMSTCSFFGQIQILMEYLWLRLCQHNEEWTGIVICLSWERGPSWPNLDSLPNQWEGWSLCLKMCQFRWLFSP